VQAVEAVGVDGPIAAVTAGWEEREDEIDELSQHLGRRVVNLRVHARGEDVFRSDAELFRAWQERRTRHRDLQDVHRFRLDAAMRVLRDLRKREGREDVLAPEREGALAHVRELDAHHLRRTAEIELEFASTWKPWERDAVVRQRLEIERVARDAGALAVAGGNVAVIANRMRLFGVMDLFGQHPVFAWSAGAMAMTERIVIFHDDPPWGRGNPVILGPGFGVCRGLVALPHARRRIRLDRPSRLRLWHARFAPLECVAFDDGSMLVFRSGRQGSEWVASSGGVRRFGPDGQLVELGTAA
jgi:hypothetical protein